MQKNDVSFSAKKAAPQSYRRPEASFASAICRGVPEKIHRFAAVTPTAAIPRRSAPLPENTFKKSQGTLPWKAMVSAKEKPGWFSPGPENTTLPTVDMVVLREVCRRGRLLDAQDA